MALLADSNIIIYSLSEQYRYLRELLIDDSCRISEISRVEVLGYHGLKKSEKSYFLDVFSYVPIIIPDQSVFDKAIEFRQKYKLKLGDSIIAATAAVYSLDLCTRNLKDFERLDGLTCMNPVI